MYARASLSVAGLALVAMLSAFPDDARWGSVRPRVRWFAVWSAILPALGLVVSLILSGVAGLLRLGQTQSFQLPGDYVGAGPVGWFTLAVFVLGVLSPSLAAFPAA